ncbi:MAG TPA: ATP-grasp domain-containing protein [Candidatus Paceibacterota bacterium]|jgi:D-alanine-D-alanine ligase
MHGTIVGVLRGGPSKEHDVSLKSGHSMLASLPREHFTVRDIYIDRSGTWHDRGKPSTPGQILPTIDMAIICIHGAYGQDGEVQKILDLFGVPYTGPDAYHAFHASHKVMAKEVARKAGVRTPRYLFAETSEQAEAMAQEAVRSFHQPVVVKPVDSGSSVGVSVVGGYKTVLDAILALFADGARGVMVEERIRGREATVGIVDGLRGEVLYALPPVEIVPPEEHDYFSYEAKYSGKSEEICPGRFTRKESDELIHLARTMHSALNQTHYSRSDFIVSDKGIYFLETNTAAAVGMTAESLMPKALASVGVTLPDFAAHLVGQTLRA